MAQATAVESRKDNFFWDNAIATYEEAENLITTEAKGGTRQPAADPKYCDSLIKTTFVARPYFAAEALVCTVLAPLAFIGTVIGTAEAIFTWGNKTATLQNSSSLLLKKVNHFILSLLGAVIAPCFAYWGKDANALLGIFKGALHIASHIIPTYDTRTGSWHLTFI